MNYQQVEKNAREGAMMRWESIKEKIFD